MTSMSSRIPWALCVQLGLALLVLCVLTFTPPARGAILIVSLTGQPRGEIARWAVGHQARLLGAGPWPHSLIVSGDRSALFSTALGQRALLIAASPAGCGRSTAA